MSSPPLPTISIFVALFLADAAASAVTPSSSSSSADPTPAPWPHQFHSVLLMNNSGKNLQMIDLWYDWTNGRNFNIIRDQLSSSLLYDLEWNNGTSFVYTLDNDDSPTCRVLRFDVGILRPDWLDGAEYLGQRNVNGFLCNLWTKADFIWYYEDVITKRPVLWVFYTGGEAHVMTFEVGAAMEDEKWQAPVYCFNVQVRDDSGIVNVDNSSGLSMSMIRVGGGGDGDGGGLID